MPVASAPTFIEKTRASSVRSERRPGSERSPRRPVVLRLDPVRPLTPVETAAAISIGATVLAVTAPAFVQNLHASRLAEPIDGINRIAMHATAMAATRAAEAAYPASVELTPTEVPRGRPERDPPGVWEHSTWRLLDFEWIVPHSYSFAFDSENEPGHARFTARAHGDLDGDGVFSSFQISGEARDGNLPVTFPMESQREIE